MAMRSLPSFGIETPFGPVQVEIGEDSARTGAPADDFETERTTHVLIHGLRARDPRITQGVLELLATRFPDRVPWGTVGPGSTPARWDALTPQLVEFVKSATRAGWLRFGEPTRVLGEVVGGPKEAVLGPSPTEDEEPTWFEVQFVDDVGDGLSGLELVFSHQGKQEKKKTDSQGVARFDGTGSFGNVRVASSDALRKLVEPRWQKARPPKPVSAKSLQQATLGDRFDSVSLESELRHVVQLMPELGRIYLELYDATGRVKHIEKPYRITGPASLSGTTDEEARLLHDEVVAGDYTLTLTLDDAEYETPAVVLRAGTENPQIRKLGVVPRSVLATVRGFVFEKNKAFVMPAALDGMKEVRDLCFSTVPNQILVVGHADTTAEPTINDPLSVERADCAKTMLLGDVDAWVAMYGSGKKEKQRWGAREDGLMIGAMPDVATKLSTETAVQWYQRTRGLKVDNDAGEKTRKKLIEEYMGLLGTPLAKDQDFHSEFTTHGCGEYFPLDETGQELDPNPEDPKEDSVDRRVDFFYFDAEFGIQPPPPGQNSEKGSTEYPTWREGVVRKYDYETPEEGMRVLRIHLLDGRGRALPVPEEGIPYRLTRAGVQLPPKTSMDGWAELITPEGTNECVGLEWGATEEEERYRYQRTVMTECHGADQHERLHARLYNIGYRYTLGENDKRDEAVAAFQRDQGLPLEPVDADGKIPAATDKRLKEIYSGEYESPSVMVSTSAEPTEPTEDEESDVDPPPTIDGAANWEGEEPIEVETLPSEAPGGELTLTAPDWVDSEGFINQKSTAMGGAGNLSPALSFSDPAGDAASYAVVLYDVLGGGSFWIHWIAFDITGTSLSENVGSSGLTLGKNSWGKKEYRGPRPEDGLTHTYRLKLYALDATGLVNPDTDYDFGTLDATLSPHTLRFQELEGKYPRPHP